MAITMNAFESMAVVTIMPAIADDLGGDRLYGAASSVYMLANLVSLVSASEQATVTARLGRSESASGPSPSAWPCPWLPPGSTASGRWPPAW